ncbi:hypothetical protein CGCSCA4_v007843 [Colletotrichum siamense]|uniref:Uncharacterized protein n=1 Tax=Colletotrichum siamense TaxID=690259 RepID=A0A9P5F0H2_COLSI|nr:hypothetical protein CGCSCA4_v007843 [Colletotrichum siamense]KAF4863302.1 hypothetical protein CGCSCA2_v002721 [Colletotrichum siamense]
MTATLSFRQEPDGSICAKDCSTRAGELQANPDVGGIGVLIGFVATAWLVVLLVVFRYCLAFDPTADPFAKPRRHQRCGLRHALKPNAVDFKITGIFRGLRGRLDHHGFWDMALNKILLKLCDVQLLTGFGLLLSSFISLTCYMSAYHWQIISYLAWFSNLTHAACLTALRQYLYRHQMERNFRMTLMVILLAGLITAIVPTGYFNWGDPGEHNVVNQGTASVPASNARCFFTQRSIQAAWESRLCKENESPEVDYPDGYPCNSKQNYYGKEKTPQATIAYESSIISILLLTLSFSSRSVKMFRILSEIARHTVRHKVGYWASLCLIATAKRYPDLRNTAWRRKFLAVFRPLDLMITFYLVVKLYLDMFLSEMADVSTVHTAITARRSPNKTPLY